MELTLKFHTLKVPKGHTNVKTGATVNPQPQLIIDARPANEPGLRRLGQEVKLQFKRP